ncbi:MAG: 2,3-bisphosphoglycerate-independent phosphoglycerate mutase [Candidatus Deianiraeaceae bacterium]|jgi:2,3-bisphosphoglycerate-independent phosphoglycerate mutase
MSKKVILCILDGFGIGDVTYKYNAVFQARTINFQRFLKQYSNALLETSGEAVGLPKGQMGNSEVGHMTIGSGRVIYQDLPRINNAIEDGKLDSKLRHLHKNNKISGTVHIVGLCSDGGVHSSMLHIQYIYKTLCALGINVILHVITDGRDVPPQSFKDTISQFDDMNIGTVAGRFFAMDRDTKLERTQAYFNVLQGDGDRFTNLQEAIDNAYDKNITDEFIAPVIINNFSGIKNDDTVFFVNFRADRVRQISEMVIDHGLNTICVTEYSDYIASKSSVLFSKNHVQNTLIDTLEKHEKNHLHIAETEKYAHVTFFFNGGREKEGDFEKRIMVPSPNVRTYDIQPEMSIHQLQEQLCSEIISQKHDFIVINIANADMVGHSGNFEASKKAAEHIDEFIGNLEKSVIENNYHLLITADHGNLEEMVDIKTGERHTQHTNGVVPIIHISTEQIALKNGTLANIAPTVLELMKINAPQEMSESLFNNSKEH